MPTMEIPKPLPQEGFPVPLKASFLVFKALPWFGVAYNNAAPRLTLFEDRLEYRVVTSARRSYADIESVDARRWIATQNVILRWRGHTFAFSGNVGAADRLAALLKFFDERGAKLTPRARQMLAAAKRK
jgi:hypothetical protein